MSFSSVSFLVFMIAVFLIYWGIPHKFRYILLICANLIFYGSFGVKYLPVLIGEVAIIYLFAIIVDKLASARNRGVRAVFALGVVLTVIQLLIFKYLDFSIYSVEKVLSILSIPVSSHTLNLIAPIGISFYTFESLSYYFDVYSGKISAEKNPLRLFAFISFFPSITSGPIERAESFFNTLDSEKTFDYEMTTYGLRLILLGLVKKICGADVLKQYVDAVFGNVYAYRGPVIVIAVILYTYEIYLDFSGYTDMARGVAYMLGFSLTENFKAPYLSGNIKEFFSRWHISLSLWLKDYIYIPLGGNRCSRLRKYFNLMVTFIVSGIWHGASFTFIVWGMLHGIYQCAADVISLLVKNKGKKSGAGKIVGIIISFILISFAWLFFRANSLSDAKYLTLNMFWGDNFYGQMLQMGFLSLASYISVATIISATALYDVISEKTDIVKRVGEMKMPVRWLIYIVFGILVIVLRSHNGSNADFIYFKF